MAAGIFLLNSAGRMKTPRKTNRKGEKEEREKGNGKREVRRKNECKREGKKEMRVFVLTQWGN